MMFVPKVSKSIFELAPTFVASSLVVSCRGVNDTPFAEDMLQKACETVKQGGPEWADAHLDAWATTFRAFGAKPQRTPCSAAALRKRTLRSGSAPSINSVVDIYNAISLKYAIPVGGENRDAYQGLPHLTVAIGSEPFDTIHNGEPTTETPEPGEVIWRDDAGVTCRRWNWRQGIRTQIGTATTNMWFVLESLEPLSNDVLELATNELVQAFETVLIDPVFELKRIRG